MFDPQVIPFPQRVLRVLELIPYGRVTTYGAIARALGSPRSARMVGWVMRSLGTSGLPDARDRLAPHRVINRNGYLSGGWYFGHPDVMRSRLEDEGVVVSDDYVVDLKMYFWDPASDPRLDEFTLPTY